MATMMEMAEEAELKDGMERDGWNGDDGKLRPAWGEDEEGPGGGSLLGLSRG